MSYLEDVTAEVIRWQKDGTIPTSEPARAIVDKMVKEPTPVKEGFRYVVVQVKLCLGYKRHVGNRPVQFNSLLPPNDSSVKEFIRDGIGRVVEDSHWDIDRDHEVRVEIIK